MPLEKSQLGTRGEKLAEKYLKDRGYQIVERNWQYKGRGEVDIIARDGSTLVFVEVRVRGPNSYETPQESITDKKIRILKRTSKLYQKINNSDSEPSRIDLVGISFSDSFSPPKIHLFKNITQER